MHAKCTIPRQKLQKFSREGAQPPPRPIAHWGEGNPPQTLHLGACGASITRAFGDQPWPSKRKSWIRQCDVQSEVFRLTARWWAAGFLRTITVRYSYSASTWQLPTEPLHAVFQAIVVNKLSYASPAWWGSVCRWSDTFGSVYAPFCHSRISWGLHLDLRQHLHQSWRKTVLQHHWQPHPLLPSQR